MLAAWFSRAWLDKTEMSGSRFVALWVLTAVAAVVAGAPADDVVIGELFMGPARQDPPGWVPIRRSKSSPQPVRTIPLVTGDGCRRFQSSVSAGKRTYNAWGAAPPLFVEMIHEEHPHLLRKSRCGYPILSCFCGTGRLLRQNKSSHCRLHRVCCRCRCWRCIYSSIWRCMCLVFKTEACRSQRSLQSS